MVNPIKPDEIVEYKKKIVPDFVIRAFNYCIAQNFMHGEAKVYQKEVIDRILIEAELIDEEIERADIYSRKLLDVEDIYRDAGWKVVYDSPSYCENYAPTFTFRRK